MNIVSLLWFKRFHKSSFFPWVWLCSELYWVWVQFPACLSSALDECSPWKGWTRDIYRDHHQRNWFFNSQGSIYSEVHLFRIFTLLSLALGLSVRTFFKLLWLSLGLPLLEVYYNYSSVEVYYRKVRGRTTSPHRMLWLGRPTHQFGLPWRFCLLEQQIIAHTFHLEWADQRKDPGQAQLLQWTLACWGHTSTHQRLQFHSRMKRLLNLS